LIPEGEEHVPWPVMAAILVVARLCAPRSELSLAENWFRKTALGDLLGAPDEKINDDRFYRALDQPLPHKEALERQRKERFGTLFCLEYDLLLYDITSTYFEELAADEALARHGYSRGLPAGVHRAGGHARRVSAGIRSLRRQPQRQHHAARGDRPDGVETRPSEPHLGRRSGDGQ
jgi:hypothetical protein